MYFFYNLALAVISFTLKIIALFQPKINLFVKGRKATFSILEKNISETDNVIWIHTASLGEFEQGLPVIEQIRKHFSEYKILITFFSPSGYEVKKNTNAANVVCYLPLDSKKNAWKFVKKVNPKIAIFVKYEIWPNYLSALEKNQIPIILISAIFKKKQIYFKWYGDFMRKALLKFDHFFVQNEASEVLLQEIGINQVTISGDTRFDRVNKIKERDNSLDFMNVFKDDQLCFIAGSTWPEDEKRIVPYINTTGSSVKFVIAPHNIKKDHIIELRKSITKKTVLYSEYNGQDLKDFEVLIVDHIGLLTKIYSYGDIAYVGGGFATGLHNTLEPAVFGMPVLIGPKYTGFKEAEELVEQKGCLSINNYKDFENAVDKFVNDNDFRKRTGLVNTAYIEKNKGASIQIIAYLRTLL
ncbi:3-deoxy-D-manno-octulosonic acid transferase [Muriicola sp. Z0-33]|uniref:3-deoxy-D-manno-octulosonic acid transferase n=1 Tax=Muriicola sp. Z0-33 TaxID=2816957 RepID=UPI0022384690|nr:glycosyltransferase N-terminal domain-containing protein [Muriicola sp. Z0-33]MCW5517255.1 3-deoxy-D-manno-octulosonic acid transferase [Muriicola sp. Z0-33]